MEILIASQMEQGGLPLFDLNLYCNRPIKIVLGPFRKKFSAESLQPLYIQKNAHCNSSMLKSRANKIPKPNPMTTIRCGMPGFSLPRPPSHARRLQRAPRTSRPEIEAWEHRKKMKRHVRFPPPPILFFFFRKKHKARADMLRRLAAGL